MAPRLVLAGARRHRLDHLLHRARQRSHLVAKSFDVEEQGVLRSGEVVDGRAQACELVAHTGQGGSAEGLASFGDRGAVMVEILGLVGEEGFVAIGANRK